MEEEYEILVLPEVDVFLENLPDVLLTQDYYSFWESAERFVDEIIDFINSVPHVPHYTLSDIAKDHFSKYGADLQYAFFKRKSSPDTTWYVFFSKMGNRYLIRYITNNHKEGAYIR